MSWEQQHECHVIGCSIHIGLTDSRYKWPVDDLLYMEELRDLGLSWPDIARELNVTRAAARRAYDRWRTLNNRAFREGETSTETTEPTRTQTAV